jgi:hypothetical protein
MRNIEYEVMRLADILEMDLKGRDVPAILKRAYDELQGDRNV